jgi:hypothetical protein
MKKLIYFTLFFMVSLSLFAQEKYDWLIKHNWFLISEYIIHEPYQVTFRKLEVLPESIMYQERLRNERFTLVYQTNQPNKLFKLEDTLSNNVYDLEFGNNYNLLSMKWGNIPYPTRQQRVGKQENKNFPLVGIWGGLPHLSEYRIVDPKGCFLYMEIKDQYPFWAIREGTYLLKQIDEKTFETISSFPDGRLRLEVKGARGEEIISLVPLFTLPDDEKGRLDPLTIICWPVVTK